MNETTSAYGFIISPWQDKFVFKTMLTGVDLEKKEATLSDGRVVKYNKMLSTMPLDLLLKMVGKDEWANDLFHSSSHIVGIGKIRHDCGSDGTNATPTHAPFFFTIMSIHTHTHTHTHKYICIYMYIWFLFAAMADMCGSSGIRGPNPHGKKCWLYFPEDNCPYYRATVFSHYAKGNCPSDDTKLKTLRHADPSVEVSTVPAS